MFRYNGKWYIASPKPGEPERQTQQIMWKLASGVPVLQAYREWYASERKISSAIYPK